MKGIRPSSIPRWRRLRERSLLGDRHYNSALVIDRLMRSFLADQAARKKGITDPSYMAPGVLDHGHRCR